VGPCVGLDAGSAGSQTLVVHYPVPILTEGLSTVHNVRHILRSLPEGIHIQNEAKSEMCVEVLRCGQTSVSDAHIAAASTVEFQPGDCNHGSCSESAQSRTGTNSLHDSRAL
jgi:hypothetical protein